MVGIGKVGLAQVVGPSCGTKAVGPLLVGIKVSCLPCSSGLGYGSKLFPKLGGRGCTEDFSR